MLPRGLRRSFQKVSFIVLLGALCALPAQGALSWQPQGTDFQVNSYTVSNQHHPAVVRDAAGNFVALWLDDSNRIRAAMNVNVWDVIVAVKPLIIDEVVVDPTRLSDPDVAYSELATHR